MVLQLLDWSVQTAEDAQRIFLIQLGAFLKHKLCEDGIEEINQIWHLMYGGGKK